MARQDANEAFAPDLVPLWRQRRLHRGPLRPLRAEPAAVDAEWRAFFGGLKDDAPGRREERPRRLVEAAGLAGAGQRRARLRARRQLGRGREGGRRQDQGRRRRRKGAERRRADVQQATRDSVRALMLIRAYRVRGHLHANLDPLASSRATSDEELDPSYYGFTEADLDRPIFLDNVLGLEFAHPPRDRRILSAPTARRSASSSCTSPTRPRRPGSRSASRGRTRRSPSPAKASARSSTS